MSSFTHSWQMPFELRSDRPDRLMSETSIDDYSLSRQLARGDERAFGIIYERYNGPIHRFAWHMIGNRPMAEEITQEVLMWLIPKLGNIDPARALLVVICSGSRGTSLDV